MRKSSTTTVVAKLKPETLSPKLGEVVQDFFLRQYGERTEQFPLSSLQGCPTSKRAPRITVEPKWWLNTEYMSPNRYPREPYPISSPIGPPQPNFSP